MTTSGAGPVLVLVLAVGVLVGCGVILLLERSLTRILLGVILIGNGVNLLILLGGRSGGAPIVGTGPVDRMSDPLSQAMVLTSIVITFGLTAFLLAVAYRSWYLTGDDEVPDDLEDRQIISRAERNEVGTADLGGEGPDDDPEQVDPEPARRRLRRGNEA
ncbi:Na(+)/H(+) antiporter subunit C [Micromonospora cremea]|uniref:Multisubunit sodium/proton antiporter, MrpC subunit n=1 Tax=Micromonospora cremea TaxID=709881 RepID=A0A1N6AYX2_9ACTN|nr:Na(+)/H(+) antiporter subunit C [Micromonospora cremea]SIN39024.1 multisubunit sodium/proton antiporter, MrpC subunit [Micromonospora cremea]